MHRRIVRRWSSRKRYPLPLIRRKLILKDFFILIYLIFCPYRDATVIGEPLSTKVGLSKGCWISTLLYCFYYHRFWKRKKQKIQKIPYRRKRRKNPKKSLKRKKKRKKKKPRNTSKTSMSKPSNNCRSPLHTFLLSTPGLFTLVFLMSSLSIWQCSEIRPFLLWAFIGWWNPGPSTG